jgi:O-antigen ligase
MAAGRYALTAPQARPTQEKSSSAASAPAQAASVDPTRPADLQKPLDHFRARTRRLRVHSLEQALLGVIAVHLVVLPWALGAMHPPAQFFSFGCSLLAFLLALIPRHYTEEESGSSAFRLVMWPKLLRFPIFWLGLALLTYLAIGALNPAWRYQTDGKAWWMLRLQPVPGLPAGVDLPFAQWGPPRMLMLYASAWLTACALWTGFTRRRPVQLLLGVVAVNGLLLALLGLAQRLVGNGKIFWLLEFPGRTPFASFVYKNHGGAYLFLTLAVTCGLAGWYYLRGQRRMEKSNPSGVLAFFATCIAVSILTSYARGATLTMLVFLLLCIGGFLLHQFRVPAEHRRPIVAFALLLVFGFFLKTGFEALRSGEAWDRIRAGLAREDASLESREWATQGTWKMFQDHALFGTGTSGFRALFPEYVKQDPRLAGMQAQWHQAHNDVLQFPAEFGTVGMIPILLGLGWWLLRLVRSYFWENAFSVATVLGLLLLVAYSWFDFPFQCPAILVTWCALWPAVTLWTQYEEQGSR